MYGFDLLSAHTENLFGAVRKPCSDLPSTLLVAGQGRLQIMSILVVLYVAPGHVGGNLSGPLKLLLLHEKRWKRL